MHWCAGGRFPRPAVLHEPPPPPKTPPPHHPPPQNQVAQLGNAESGVLQRPNVSDDEIRETIEANQLKLQRARGADLTLFSPRASAMGHHIGDERVSHAWTETCNDLI